MNDYDDIININHYEPNYKHPRMSIFNRSAQFAPFAALTGFDDEVKETQRLTDQKKELDEDEKSNINNKLLEIKNNQEVTFEYFIKDNRKSGGKYIEKNGIVKRIDLIHKQIILFDKTIIPINDIINIK